MSKYRSRFNIAPADYIRRELDFYHWTQKDLACRLGLSENTVSAIMRRKQSVTPDTAQHLEALFGEPASFWLTVDAEYRARLAADSQPADRRSEDRMNLYKLFPLSALMKRGWLSAQKTLDSIEEGLLRLFSSSELQLAQASPAGCHLRQSKDVQKTTAKLATLTWERIAALCAGQEQVVEYSRTAVERLSSDLAALSTAPDGVTTFVKRLNDAGVKFLVLKPFDGTRISGMCFMDIRSHNPVVVYSGLYGRADHFWFTMAHELGHVLNDLSTPVVISDTEKMADEHARETLHTLQILSFFDRTPSPVTKRLTVECADRFGVSPAIVVGVLHYYKRVPYNRYNDLIPHILDSLAPWMNVEASVAPYAQSA
ncbi:MAG: helix-turn-helix domain-containing protein [Candidatus Cryosericum sp.]